MNCIKKVSSVLGLSSWGDVPLLLTREESCKGAFDKVVVESLQNFKVCKDQEVLFYQKSRADKDNSLFVVDKSGETRVYVGDYDLSYSHIVGDKFFVLNGARRKFDAVCFTDMTLTQTNIQSGLLGVFGDFLYRFVTDRFEFKRLDNDDLAFSLAFSDFGLKDCDRPHRYIFSEFFIVKNTEGFFACYDLNKRKLLWHGFGDLVSQVAFYADKLYVIFQGRNDEEFFSRLEEMDPRTGQRLRSVDLMPYEGRKENFYFTGGLKVFENRIIFIQTANRKGVYLVFDRNKFAFETYVSLGSRCSPRVDNVHLIGEKLYILDLNETLHICDI